MKTILFLTLALLVALDATAIFAQQDFSAQYVGSNPNAPAGYDANIKSGVIYLRDTQADHPYCYAAYINVVQNYAGGGRYAASRAALLNYYLVGCPAGAK